MKKPSQKLPNPVLQGLNLFNQRKFYEAHEDFETAWRETPGDERELYRALLQISGGFFRLSQGNAHGAEKFFSRASGWLSLFPESFRGLNTAVVHAKVKAILHDLERERHPSAVLEQHFQPILINNPESEQ